jgi:hypothetical protein
MKIEIKKFLFDIHESIDSICLYVRQNASQSH